MKQIKIKFNKEILENKFAEYFIFISACWFWLLSIIFMLGGLIPKNYELTFSFESLLISYVITNMLFLTIAFIIALFSSKKEEKK